MKSETEKKANFIKVCKDHLTRMQTLPVLDSVDEERQLRITNCLAQQREFLIHHAIREYAMMPFQSLKEFVANEQNILTIDLCDDNLNVSANETSDQTISQSSSKASASIADHTDLVRIDAFLSSPSKFSVDTEHWNQDIIDKLNTSGIRHVTSGSLKTFELKQYTELEHFWHQKISTCLPDTDLPDSGLPKSLQTFLINQPQQTQQCIDWDLNIAPSIMSNLKPFQLDTVKYAIQKHGRLL